MANITTCSECDKLYEAHSEEAANEPDRKCNHCWVKAGLNAAAPYFAIPKSCYGTKRDEDENG